ncbi:MAG: hypothetical protein IT353_22530, partial [Gemmatimonadaceae bacterium]|nr:hypothetical protein [Gemmatimonadaceae bacterium]
MSAVPTNINGTLQLAGAVRFEWASQTRRLSYAASVLLLVLAALALVSTGFGPASLAINGAYIVTESVALITLLAVFGLPMLCVSAVVRDDEYRMRELIASTPVSLRVLLGGRLLGVCAAALAAMVVAVLALAILPQIITTPADRLMPPSVAPYLSAFVLIVIPNPLFCVALVFGVAAVTRSTLATFAASIAIYAGYWVIAMMVDSPLMAGARPATPELLSRAARLDPFALSAFFEQTRYWTPTQRNTQTIALSGNLLINRTWVVLLSVLAIAPLPWVLSREVSLGSMSRWRRSPRPRADSPAQGVGAVVDASTPTRAQRSYSPSPHDFARWRHAFFAIAGLESTVLLMSWPIRVLLALWAAMIGIEAFSQLSSGEYGTRMLASSGVLADTVPQGLWLIGTLCVLYFAADAVHRERLLRIDGVIDATPVDDSAVLTGKLVALALVPVAFTLVGYGAAMTVHATHPGLPIDPRVYGWHALTSLWPLLTFAGVAVALQVAIGNRWLALFAGLVLVVLAEQGEALGLEHPLLRFGAAPRLQWSDLDGFGAPFTSWVAFQSLWTLCALTAMSLAAVFGSRANATPRKRWLPWVAASGASRAMFAVCGMAFVIGYGLMVYATTGSDRWQSVATAQTWRASYERTFRLLAMRPQPSVIDAQLDISLEPTRRRAVVQGIVTLENRHDVAIDSVWVSLPRDAEQPSVTVAGAHVAPAPGAFGVHVVALARSLRSRERITLAYSFTL